MSDYSTGSGKLNGVSRQQRIQIVGGAVDVDILDEARSGRSVIFALLNIRQVGRISTERQDDVRGFVAESKIVDAQAVSIDDTQRIYPPAEICLMMVSVPSACEKSTRYTSSPVSPARTFVPAPPVSKLAASLPIRLSL